MPKKLPLHTQRMLDLMTFCIQTGKCNSKKDFMESIGFPATNMSSVRRGIRGFTIEQYIAASKKYKVNMNWLTGLSDNMKQISRESTPIERLESAVREVKALLK